MSPPLPGLPLLAGFFGGWEMVLMLAIVLILLGAKRLPDLGSGLRRGIEEFLRAGRDANEAWTASLRHDRGTPSESPKPSRADELILWLAQGLDVGRIPVAPGTFGSVVGLLWFAVLLVPGSLLVYLLGSAAAIALSVWCCGRAEKILGETDPGSVVLDEIAAIPVCFLPWVIRSWLRGGALPAIETFVAADTWWRTLVIFGLFRLFDVAKPWPVRQSQACPGGWGVTIDDLLAALYVALASSLLLP